jgi:DNA-binding beta-propeller fold protein YncE
MKFRTNKVAALLLLGSAMVWESGCGGSGANVVVDTVSPTATTVIAGTTQVFTSTVTGSTNLDSTWTCTYVYTPAATTATPNPVATTAANCTSGQTVNGGSIGTWTTDQTTADNTLSYSAPALSNFPNPIPTITFTAAAAANTSKKGTVVVGLDTGIRVSVTPATATMPVGLNPAQEVQFTASFLNVSPADASPKWAVMQPVAGSSTTICNDFPPLTSGGTCGAATPKGITCSPNCGTISQQGVFTAPATMPTDTFPVSSGSTASTAAPTVTLVVSSADDPNEFAFATITLVNSTTNPLTFTGIHPTTIAAGGILQDIFLDANNLLNTTPITFTPPGNNQTAQVIDPSEVFTIPITLAYCTPSASGVTPVVTCNASIMTRIRLNGAQLANAGVGQITVNNIPDPANPGNTVSISYPINLVYASPAIVGAVPDSFPQGTAAQFSTDGGYYGGGSSPIVNLLFDGNLNVAKAFGPRQFTGPLQGSQIPSPGLYPVSIVSNAPLGGQPPFNPPPYPTVTTNVAVQPLFAGLSATYNPTTTPAPPQAYPPNIPLLGAATAAPSSIAINSTKGYAVITEQGANAIEVVNFVANASGRYTPVLSGSQIAVGNQPTSVAIDDQIDLTAAGFAGQDLGVVVNSADSTLTLVALPSGAIIGSPISLSGLVQEPTGTTAPLPYAVGVDTVTHYAVVAFSNAFVGFVVDVNPNPIPSGQTGPACFVTSQTLPCAIAAVSLNTGATPQVVMQPNVPLAYVTPGGTGVTSVVNLLLTNNSVAIAASPNGAIRTNDVVTITTPNPNGLNQSAPGTVLIAGVSPADFNGTYNVLSASTYTFTYEQTGGNETGGGGTVTFGNPYYTFSTTSTAVGGAINPVTRTFAFADPNASTAAPQVGFIQTLDQSVSSLFLTVGSCNSSSCMPTPAGAPEVGVRYVSWDPFTNVLVAYNPASTYNEISLINPGGPTANGLQNPYRIIAAIPTGQTGSYTPSGSSTPSVFGPMAYDPKTNLVLVANSGSNTLTYLDIDPQSTFKKVAIKDVQFQLIQNSGGVPNGQPPLASVTAPNAPPVAVCDPTNPISAYTGCFPHGVTIGQPAYLRILGQGFLSGGAPTVRLDGDSTGITITNSSDAELDVTIAATRLTNPHDFALDVLSGSVNSNTNDLYAVQVTPMAGCGTNTPAQPEGVAIDNIANVAVVTNYGCNNVSFINMDSTNAHNYGVPYGTVLATATVGANPIGVGVIPRLGYAVTANNGEGSASIIQYGGSPFSAKTMSFTSASCTTPSGSVTSTNICVGISPVGATIDQDRALALIANTGGNSVSAIDLTPLLLATPGVPPMQLIPTSGPPTAIAVDPNRAVAVVTNIQNLGTSSASGGLDVIDLSAVPPTKTTTASISSLTANPTGIVYDPAVSPALFYATSTQENAVYSFDPDTGSTSLIQVGVNPFSIAYNFQTGTLVSVNSTSNTSSVIDAVNAPVFNTRETLGISSQSQFAVAIDDFTNTAVIADQNNNRILIVPMPK